MKSSFERKFGKYAIKNLTLYLIIGYIIGYVLQLVNPAIYSYLPFNPDMIMQGQIWRLVTWVLVPPDKLNIFTIIMLLLYYNLGTNLERTWGTYRYNLYIFSGFLFTIVGSFITYMVFTLITGTPAVVGTLVSYYVSTYYINMSIFLAFALTYPDMQLLLCFFIPVKVKWFAFIYGAYILFDIYTAFAYYPTRYAIICMIVILMSLLNFFVFWITGRFKVNYVQGAAKRKREYKQKVNEGYRRYTYGNGAVHKCAICGRTEKDNPDLIFRYCTKCSGDKEYCQDHLFTHEHR